MRRSQKRPPGASREVPSPTAFSEIRSPLTLGFPHPVRCAFRFSQPPDAFLLRIPSGTVSAGNALGVLPSEPSPCNQPGHPLGAAYLLAVSQLTIGPASRLLADCRSATLCVRVRVTKSALLSWACASPGISPTPHQGPAGPFLSWACLGSAHCAYQEAVQRLDARDGWLGSPEPAAPPEVFHLIPTPLARRHLASVA